MSGRSASRFLFPVVLVASSVIALQPFAALGAGPYSYFAVTPCRVVDTRCQTGVATGGCPFLDTPNGQPALVGNGPPRDFKMRGNCGVPTTAVAVSLNATIVPQTSTPGNFYLSLWPSGGAQPTVSTLNFTQNDVALANGAIVPVSTNTNDLSAFASTFNTAHLILDITGYFAP